MKRLAVAVAVLAAGLAVVTPASAGHDVRWRRHDVVTGGYFVSGGGGQFYYAKPGVSFSFGFGYPAPYVYAPAPVYVAPPPVYVAPPPVYYAPPVRYYYGLPVVVAPSHCNSYGRAHYVLRGGHYYRHKGHGHHRHHHHDD